MKNKKLWITAVLLSGMLALPVQAAVISPGSENVRRSTVTKTAVSPKTGEGTGESVALLLACVSASAGGFSDPERKIHYRQPFLQTGNGKRRRNEKIKVVCDHTFSALSGALCTGSEPDPTKNGPNHTENIHGSG